MQIKKQSQQIKKLTLGAALSALALVLSLLESALPSFFPLPGMKLGLANIVTVFALYTLGTPSAFMILTARILLGSVFSGQLTGFFYSFTGGMLAMLTMSFMKRLSRCTIYGVSVSGAAAHSIGQVAAACVLTGSLAPVAYLAPMLFLSLFTGALSAFTVSLLLGAKALRKFSQSAFTET